MNAAIEKLSQPNPNTSSQNFRIGAGEVVLSPADIAACYGLDESRLEAFGARMDAIRERQLADLGERDAKYIRRVIKVQRGLEVGGRGLLFLSLFPPAWVAGTTMLGLSKILDNMEIGHNVMHGQYDWMNDPKLNSKRFEWDSCTPSENWRVSHNYEHHTFTNIVGRDRDVGYGILRMSPDQKWHPVHLGNPLYATLLALNFDTGVSLHDLETDELRKGNVSWQEKRPVAKKVARKTLRQFGKDYLLFPLLAGPFFLPVLLGNLVANVIRNLWTFTIIFCGHFPAGVEQFEDDGIESETRGQWYFRQLLGSANITGGKLFHVMSGNLSHQIEHHLFPDVPAHRYADMAIEVQAVCEEYGLPYNKGPLLKQFGTVVSKIFKLALPNRRNPTNSDKALTAQAI